MNAKSWIALLVILCIMLSFGALASGASYIECACGNEPCNCFIQLGDVGDSVRGIIRLLKEQGFCAETHSDVLFDAELEVAVKAFQAKNDLAQSGAMDDDTLTLLIWGMSAEALDEKQPELDTEQVWIPTNGGFHRHSKSYCSNMIDPRMVSTRNAIALGFIPCDNCLLLEP